MIDAVKKIQKTMYVNILKTRKAPKNGMPKLNMNRLVKGNSKLDKSILIFDLLAGSENGGVCKSNCFKCYAIQAQEQYINTVLFRGINTILAKTNIPILFNLVNTQIKKSKKSVVRIHSSGDFFSQEYINMWDSIIQDNPTIKFYAYTKRINDFDFSNINSNDNFNLINSIVLLDGKECINYGDSEYIKTLSENGYFVCPATKDNWKGMCGNECKYCITGKKVCFHIHFPGKRKK
jgi:hypothetical protein